MKIALTHAGSLTAVRYCVTANLFACVLAIGVMGDAANAQRAGSRQVPAGTGEPVEAGIDWAGKPVRVGPADKISDRLHRTIQDVRSLGQTKQAVMAGRPERVSDHLQKVTPDGLIQCYVDYTGDAQAVAAAVRTAGGRIELVSPEMDVVQALVPYDRFDALAANPVVTHIRPPGYAFTRTGSLNSQGDAVHRTNIVRSTRGWTGAGVKVGVISDGINGITASQSSGDIPPTYQAQSARSDGNLLAGPEGTAMMEIVYDLAPGAALAFSNPGTSAEMVGAINILDSTFHCNVICDDLGFADDPWFADGAIVSRINQAVANGAIYASAAGNDADQNYYQGAYVGMTKKIQNKNIEVQSFAAGDWNMQAYVQGGGGWIVVILQWNDVWGASGNDYDLLLTDSNGSKVYTASEDPQNGSGFPIEAVQYVNNGANGVYVQVVVRRYSGANRYLKIASWGYGWFTEYSTPEGSIYGHSAGTNVIACGAIRASTPATVETFSSRGPVRIDYPSLTYRNKPDVCGADGVSVSGNGGFPTTFYGTSAAAPHVAAICAQLWSADPTRSNAEIRSLVQNTSVDLLTAGFDTTSGFGRADAVNAANAMVFLPVPGDFDGDGDVDPQDLDTFISCRTAPGTAHNGTPACQSADFDQDNDVDQEDFGTFQNCLSGTDVPGDPHCAGA